MAQPFQGMLAKKRGGRGGVRRRSRSLSDELHLAMRELRERDEEAYSIILALAMRVADLNRT